MLCGGSSSIGLPMVVTAVGKRGGEGVKELERSESHLCKGRFAIEYVLNLYILLDLLREPSCK